jgi:ubiquinone/menaquinone biosynthesis C-methylase UbiE
MVIAVEPSANMRQQRLAAGKSPAINASAELLPFDDNSFDAAMAMITIHHWKDLDRGIAEMRRVAKGPVVIMTFDPEALHLGWLANLLSGTGCSGVKAIPTYK